MMIRRKLCMLLWLLTAMLCRAQVWQYVDPRIGSEGVGRTFPGPSMPFGMCKPGPDCTVKPNAGWAPMPEVVTGFSQTHVSGTGGGQKYGNILILPSINKVEEQRRVSEDIALGYYAATFDGLLLVDATHYLGKDSVPDGREKQQFVGAEVEVTGDREIVGYTRIRGGWNNGDAYTVYFCLQSDKAFQPRDCADGRTVLWMNDSLVNIKIGISYVSTQQARRNIPDCDFDTQLKKVRNSWEQLLSRFQIEGTDRDKRLFYTALYHTLFMPVDKSGENPKWRETPYYDDYYPARSQARGRHRELVAEYLQA